VPICDKQKFAHLRTARVVRLNRVEDSTPLFWMTFARRVLRAMLIRWKLDHFVRTMYSNRFDMSREFGGGNSRLESRALAVFWGHGIPFPASDVVLFV